MGHVLTIESDEAFALATELATLTGVSVETAVVAAVRARLETERASKAKVARVLALAAEIRESLPQPLPSSDTNHLFDYLYEDGRDR